MESAQEKLRDLTLTVRMNKYYHQTAARNYSWLDSAFSLVTLGALVVGGLSTTLNWLAPYRDMIIDSLVLAAGISSLVVVVIKLSDKIRQHEALFRRFNEIDARLIGIEAELSLGESDSHELLTKVYEEEEGFVRLEGEQPHPAKTLLSSSYKKVLGEIGHAQN